jgi:hypothetical protein
MELSGGVGGGVLLALAAGLWLVYLIPSWLRRREYLATERNAVRLQQTLRVLAETAEVPHAVRAETSARSVAVQQKALREAQARAESAQRAMDAAARRTAARAVIEAQPAIAAVVSARTIAARRLRRTRAVASLLLLAAVITIAVQLVLMAAVGIAAGAWAVLGFSAVVAVSSFSLLGRLAAVSRSRAAAVAAYVPAARRFERVELPVVEPVQSTWTPVPVPKPMYLSRTVMQNVVVEADVAVAELQAAAASAQAALRAAEASLPSISPTVESAETRTLARLDIDEVLRRRRAAG